MTTKRAEARGVREIHAIRERIYEERKSWTAVERREQVERIGEELIKRLGLRLVAHEGRRAVVRTVA